MPKPYPKEFRQDVVRVARNHGPGVTVEQVATDFGVHPMMLWKWMRRADVDDVGGSSPRRARAAALDMFLHMIRNDQGSAVAAQAARMCVMPLEREGGQAQFIVRAQPPAPAGATMEPVLSWLEEQADRDDLTLADIAARAGMSTRTLNRRFREQTDTTLLQWLHRARVRRAQHLLETTTYPVERIASQAGFGSPTAFRDRFKRVVGTSPYAYRRAFQGTPADSCGPAVS